MGTKFFALFFFTGGAFNLEPRYAIVNMVTGVSLVFGASTPLLYPFAVIYLAIQFWGDKYVFVRTASIPERTDDSVNYNMSTKQISTLARVIDKETSTFRKNYDKDISK